MSEYLCADRADPNNPLFIKIIIRKFAAPILELRNVPVNAAIDYFRDVTILEFNDLEIDEKARAVWMGTFLADRDAEGWVVQLYRVTGFYAEVYYDHSSNKIVDIRSFTSNIQLAPYVALKKIKTL